MPVPSDKNTPPDGDDRPPGKGDPADPENHWRPLWMPVPKRFFSEETGQPFDHCVDCGANLHDENVETYLIQKCSNGRETVFEFALCQPCGQALQEDYSEASRAAIARFFHQRVDLEARARNLRQPGDPPDLDPWLETCLTCNQPKEPGLGFAMVALCAGSDLFLTHSPFMVCERCEIELNDHISPETRGRWDRFVGENFDLPPSLSKSPAPRRPIMV